MKYKNPNGPKNLLSVKLSLYFKSIDRSDFFYLAWFMPLTSLYLGRLCKN